MRRPCHRCDAARAGCASQPPVQVPSLRLEVVTGGRRQPGPRRPHRAMPYRTQCPMPHQGWRSWFQPCTLRIQRTALLPQAAAGPRTKKSSAAFMQNQSPAKTARRRQLVDTGVAPLSAEHIGRWLAWGPALRPSPPDARHDPILMIAPLKTRPASSGRSPRGGARAVAHTSGGIDTVNMEGVNLRLG